MSGAAAFNISMVFRADIAAAKAGLSDLTGGMRAVSTEAGKTSAAVSKEAAELQQLAAAAAKASLAQQDLVTAERRSQEARNRALIAPLANPAANSFVAPFRASETAAASLRDTIGGLNVTIGATADDFMASAQAGATYRAMLDDVRASFNPLFAASRQYEQQLDRIAEAERLGAISAREAVEARQRAASIIAPVGQSTAGGTGFGNTGMTTAYFAAQANDVAMMAALGQNPMTLALQQGPQISQMLNQMGGGAQAVKALGAGILSMMNPLSLATIGIIGLGTAAVQWFSSSDEKAKSFAESVGDLSKQLDAITAANRRARTSVSDLRAEFGGAAELGRDLYVELAKVEQRLGDLKIGSALKVLPDDFRTGFVASALGPLSTPEFQDVFDIGRFDGAGLRKAAAVQSAAQTVSDAEGRDAQITALEQYVSLYEEAAQHSGEVKENEAAGLKAAYEMLVALRQMKAIEENAFGKEQAGGMARDLERRAELEQTILRYGAQSAQVRSVENRQEREALALRLQDLGITQKDEEGRKALAVLADVQAARNATAREERRAMLRDQDDHIAMVRLEIDLIGKSNEEAGRARALAEAELEIRDRNLGLLDGMLARLKAITAAEAENRLARAQAMRDLQIEAMGDAYDTQIALTRDPISRANLEAQKEYSRLLAESGDAQQAEAKAALVRARAINEAITAAQVQAADMAEELQIRTRIAEQVAAGSITSAEANRLIREEVELRPLVAAAARAEGAEKQRLLDVITSLRLGYAAMAEQDRVSAINDELRAGAERLQQLQVETALMGQNATVRNRILALIEAEQRIRALGASGAAADELRRQARDIAEQTRELEKQAEAWGKVQSSSENAIDGTVDALMKGDIEGALESIAAEITSLFTEIAVKNPLKNALLGTDYATISDVGGLGGIFDRLMGRKPIDEQGVISAGARAVQAMQVQAAQVIINAGALSGIPGLPANANAAPGTGGMLGAATLGGLGGPADVQRQIWSFFAQKGLAPHQIAGVMGNIYAESRFDPTALQKGGNGTGLFQHDDRRFKLLDFIGGKQNLGDVQKQLEFAWHELMTTESRAFGNLMSSTDVRGATEAFLGFERPKGFTWGDPTGSHQFDTRLGAAEAALTKFGASAQTATTDLSTLGGGMGAFGSALQGFAQGGPEGALNGLLGALGSAFAGALGIPGFASGGDHRGGLRIVGENGPELEATGPSRIFNAAQTRDILTSRAPAFSAASAPMSIDSRPIIQISNNSSVPVTGEVEETSDARGQRQYELVMSDVVAKGLSARGGQGARTMRNVYGMAPATRRRG